MLNLEYGVNMCKQAKGNSHVNHAGFANMLYAASHVAIEQKASVPSLLLFLELKMDIDNQKDSSTVGEQSVSAVALLLVQGPTCGQPTCAESLFSGAGHSARCRAERCCDRSSTSWGGEDDRPYRRRKALVFFLVWSIHHVLYVFLINTQ